MYYTTLCITALGHAYCMTKMMSLWFLTRCSSASIVNACNACVFILLGAIGQRNPLKVWLKVTSNQWKQCLYSCNLYFHQKGTKKRGDESSSSSLSHLCFLYWYAPKNYKTIPIHFLWIPNYAVLMMLYETKF